MPIELIAERRGEALVPINENARAAFLRMREGKVVRVEVTHSRNGQFLKLYWVLVDLIYDAAVDDVVYPSRQDFHCALKLMCGVRRRIVVPADIRNADGEIMLRAGETCFEPGSIAFHNMSDETFSRFFSRLCDLIVTYWLPGQTEAWLRAEVAKICRIEVPPRVADDGSPLVIPTDIEPDDRDDD